jgi:hypothetical protein
MTRTNPKESFSQTNLDTMGHHPSTVVTTHIHLRHGDGRRKTLMPLNNSFLTWSWSNSCGNETNSSANHGIHGCFSRTKLAFLWILTISVIWDTCQGTDSEAATPMDVLVSTAPNVTVFSCFSVDWEKDEETVDGSKDLIVKQRQECCEGIHAAYKTLFKQEKDFGSQFFFKSSCLLELAEMPLVTILSQLDTIATASFSWWVPAPLSSLDKAEGSTQILFHVDQNQSQPIQFPISPYHLSAIGDEERVVPLPSSSALDPNGGMHRLLEHSLQLRSDIETFVLVVLVPQGMFIDLDDPLETGNNLKALPRQSSLEKNTAISSFDLQTLLASPSTTTASLHLYAAHVCNIEQPAFVSGQHVLAWEIDVVAVNAQSLLLEFATKLHLRYPQPSPNMYQVVNLPRPLLLGLVGRDVDTTTIPLETQYMEILERIRVAAGNDDDHDVVMWITMACCFLGVVLMLQDISRMSLWDDV